MKSCYCCGGSCYRDKAGYDQWITNKPTDFILCGKCYGWISHLEIHDKIVKKNIEKYATRQCYSCGKVGIPPMRCYLNQPTDLILCNYCYNNLFLQKKKNIQRRKHGYNDRRFIICGKTIILSKDPRIGVCNWCRAVINIDCKKTNLHHDQNQYDINDPLKHTIELCVSCHRKETLRLRNLPTTFRL